MAGRHPRSDTIHSSAGDPVVGSEPLLRCGHGPQRRRSRPARAGRRRRAPAPGRRYRQQLARARPVGGARRGADVALAGRRKGSRQSPPGSPRADRGLAPASGLGSRCCADSRRDRGGAGLGPRRNQPGSAAGPAGRARAGRGHHHRCAHVPGARRRARSRPHARAGAARRHLDRSWRAADAHRGRHLGRAGSGGVARVGRRGTGRSAAVRVGAAGAARGGSGAKTGRRSGRRAGAGGHRRPESAPAGCRDRRSAGPLLSPRPIGAANRRT